MIPLKDSVPTERTPWLTIVLIVANVLVYFGLQGGGILSGPSDTSVIEFGAIPYEITHPGDECAAQGQQLVCGDAAQIGSDQPPTWLTVLTSMFMHGSILHLAGNMLFLWIFGNNIEDSMGPVRFVVFYLLGGLAALLLQVAVGPNAAIPEAARSSTSPATSGASGPTTTRSTSRSRASATRSSPGRHSTPSAAMPALPGAASTSGACGLRSRVRTSACSRPPPPTTRTCSATTALR